MEMAEMIRDQGSTCSKNVCFVSTDEEIRQKTNNTTPTTTATITTAETATAAATATRVIQDKVYEAVESS